MRKPTLCVVAFAVALGGVARAQVSPQGIHHPTVGPGAGLAPSVSPTGGYSASVPLDLPSPRAGLPVPLSINYNGGTSAGAAGVGWDVPFWYVQRSTTPLRRKPEVTTDGSLRAATRMYVSLGGGPQLMVPRGNVHVPYMSSEYGELSPDGTGGWKYRTLDNVVYQFRPWHELAGIPSNDGFDIWLLTSIHRVGNTELVQIDYETTACTGSRELSMSKISFTRSSAGTPLYEIKLDYGSWHTGCDIFDRVDDEKLSFLRRKLLRAVNVVARNNLDPTLQAKGIRSYSLRYQPDPDTRKPRLAAVSMTGDKDMIGDDLPVAQYEYGFLTHATNDPSIPRELRYGEPVEVARPGGLGDMGQELATSEVETQEILGTADNLAVPPDLPYFRGRLETTRSRYTMRDFTGDGVTDLLYRRDGTWRLHPGRLATDGVSFANTPTIWSANNSDGPSEIHVQTTFRAREATSKRHKWAREAAILTETWVSVIDWNGDGRLDVIDVKAGQTLDYWKIWLNQPTSNGGVHWLPTQVSIGAVRSELAARGFQRDDLHNKFPTLDWDNWLTLERTRSWNRLQSHSCTPYECELTATMATLDCKKDEGEGCEDVELDPDQAPGLDSITDWGLRDINSDGFPDFAIARAPARYCETNEVSGTSQQCGANPQEEGDYYCTTQHHEWLWSSDECDDDVAAHAAGVFFNRTGPFIGSSPPFHGTPTAFDVGRNGIEHWTNTGNDNPRSLQGVGFVSGGNELLWRAWGLSDVDGTGWLAPDGETFVEGSDHADVGFISSQSKQCGDSSSSSTPYTSTQETGYFDFNGDGMLDTIRSSRAFFNTSCHCSAVSPFRIASPISGDAISVAAGTCGGSAETVSAYTDMDGDGKPEALRIVDGRLMMSYLIPGGGENLHAVGRLIAITNGYGARTEITYGNAKIDYVTAHLPFPEIVVRKTQTKIVDGSAPNLVPTFYSYGGPKMEYDPLSGRWAFAGYGKVISLTGELTELSSLVDGVMSVVEHAPLATPGASFGAHAAANRPIRSSQAEGVFPLSCLRTPDSLGPLPFTETALRSAVAIVVPTSATGSLECADLDPATGHLAGFARCGAAGIVYDAEVESWEGLEGPPSLRNRMTRVTVTEVDGFGRPTRVHDEGDVRSTLDDLCTTTSYATPAGGGAFPTRPDTVVLTDCGYGPDGGSTPGTPHFLSVLKLRYDGLPAGQVYEGRLTSRIVDRYDETGYRDTFTLDTRAYDGNGEVRTVTRSRTLGGAATQTTTMNRDEFAASVTSVSTSASDVGSVLTRNAELSSWPSRQARTVDTNGIAAVTDFDRFGRVVREVSEGSDGSRTTLSLTTYDDNPDRRVVITETFPAGAIPKQEGSATERGRRLTVLDALGRPRFSQSDLGADYRDATMISGLVEYDVWGRAVFVAAPFEWPDPDYKPDDDHDEHFGVTSVFDRRGRVVRSVEAEGRNQTAVQTSTSTHVFVTDFQFGYESGFAHTYVQGPDENDPTSPRANHKDNIVSNARGRDIERVRLDTANTRLDLVRYRWDRMGRRVAIDRYVDPQSGNVPVSWSTSYDSLGRTLSMTEPGAATRFMSYDELGNPLESWWQDGVVRKISRNRYDGFGRVTESTLVTETSGNEVVDSVDRFHYDEQSSSRDQPDQPRLRGRLSWAETEDVGAVYYTYDAFGRPQSTSYRYDDHDQLVRQQSEYTVAGRVTGITLETESTFDQIGYQYDSAGRVTQVFDGNGNTYWQAQPEFDGFYPEIALGNGVVETHARETEGRKYSLGWEVTARGDVWAHDYRERDALGRLTLEAHERPGQTELRAHEYDSLGRLSDTVELALGIPRFESYTYDALGNVTSRDATTSSGLRTYEYGTADPDRLCRSVPGSTTGPCNVTYDAIGNVLTDVTHGTQQRFFKYDPAGRILRIDRNGHSATMTYGPAGRAHIQIDGIVDRDFWSFGGLIEEQHRGGDVQVERHIPGPLGIIATLRSNGYRDTTIYNHGDGRANRVYTDESGSVVQAPTFAAYGRVTQNNVSDPMTFTDDLWNGGDDIPELGVALLGPRAYDPDLGRFLQRDPIAVTSRSTAANPYAFAFSDPVNFSDPTGLCAEGGSGSCKPPGSGSGGTIVGNVVLNAAGGALSAARGGSAGPAVAVGADDLSYANAGKVIVNAFATARANCGLSCSFRDSGISLAKFAWTNDVMHNPIAQRKFAEGFVDTVLDEASSNLDKFAKCGMGGIGCVLLNEAKDAGSALIHAPGTIIAVGSAVISDPEAAYNAACPNGDCAKTLGGVAAMVAAAVVSDGGSVAKARQIISKLSRSLFKPLRCVGCAEAVVDALKAEGLGGEILHIRANPGIAKDFIVNDLVNPGKSITKNGYHRAVRVADTVFDNYFPEGVPYDVYVKSLHSHDGVTIVIEQF